MQVNVHNNEKTQWSQCHLRIAFLKMLLLTYARNEQLCIVIPVVPKSDTSVTICTKILSTKKTYPRTNGIGGAIASHTRGLQFESTVHRPIRFFRSKVVAQLVEQAPEIHGSNPVIANFHLLSTVLKLNWNDKTKKTRRPGTAQLKITTPIRPNRSNLRADTTSGLKNACFNNPILANQNCSLLWRKLDRLSHLLSAN